MGWGRGVGKKHGMTVGKMKPKRKGNVPSKVCRVLRLSGETGFAKVPKMKTTFCLLGAATVAAMLSTVPVRAARTVAVPEPPPAAEETPDRDAWTFGGDFRLRQEAFDHIPLKTGAEARGGENDYFRFRTRVWGAWAPADWIKFNARLLHECRYYLEPSHSHSWRWPDELVPDALNVELKSADGTLHSVIGRQDFMPEGEFRLFGEGTAKDGSRSSYMDAVSVVARDEKDRTRLTLFGVYDNAVDPLAIGNIDRDLNGYGPNDTGMDESGAGAFLRHAFAERLRATAYYLWKHDSSSILADGSRRPNEDIHTVGGRLAVPLGGPLSADAEVAGQWSPTSDDDRRAMMASTALRADWREATAKPGLSLNGLYLSGDDPDTAEDEGWNPLWGRYPWISELMIYAYDADGAGLWQNLVYAWAEAASSPRPGHRVRATAGPLYAPEANGAGGGHDRGWLGTVRWDFPLWRTAAESPRIYGHIFAEALLPGDYYDTDEDLAYFLRWELTLGF